MADIAALIRGGKAGWTKRAMGCRRRLDTIASNGRFV
jgi:hypothetical protein